MVRRKPVHGSRDGFGGPSKVRLGISITAPALVAGLLMHYLPLATTFFALLVGIFIALVVLI